MADLLGQLCGMLCCLGVYAGLAGGVGYLLHLRTKRVEAQLGRRAVPVGETAWLFYAGASLLWLSAVALAIAGFVRRDWTRVGRDCAYLFLGHMGLATIGALGAVLSQEAGGSEALGIVSAACVIVLVSALASAGCLWRWGSLRVARIEGEPPTGAPPGAERWAIYLVSALVGAVGLVAPAIYRAPQNVAVGVTASRIGLAHLLLIALAVCVCLPVLTAVAGL